MFCGEPLLILACRARPAPDYQFHPFFGTFPNSLIIKAPFPTTYSPAPGLSFQVNLNHLRTPYNIFIRPPTNNISNLFHSLHQIVTQYKLFPTPVERAYERQMSTM